jgi:probable HAF family extracellular repeat protein
MPRYSLFVLPILGFLLNVSATAQAPLYIFETLHIPGSIQTQAEDINNRGQIVGFYFSSSKGYGFLYEDGIVTQLDVPLPGVGETKATAINDVGQIVEFYAADTFAVPPHSTVMIWLGT